VGDERRDAGLCHHGFVHELIEACSDPNINTIIVQGGPGSACPDPTRTCEIGDVCSSFGIVGALQVQSYGSKARQPLHSSRKTSSNGELTGNPVLIQGRFLHPGNFEMACPLERRRNFALLAGEQA